MVFLLPLFRTYDLLDRMSFVKYLGWNVPFLFSLPRNGFLSHLLLWPKLAYKAGSWLSLRYQLLPSLPVSCCSSYKALSFFNVPRMIQPCLYLYIFPPILPYLNLSTWISLSWNPNNSPSQFIQTCAQICF